MLKLLHTYSVDGVRTDVLIELRKLEHRVTANGLERVIVHDAAAFEADGVTPTGYDIMAIELAFADALNSFAWGQSKRAQKLRFPVDFRTDGDDTRVVVKVRRMTVIEDSDGGQRVRLDDWDVFAADGVTPVDLDKIDDPAGDELPGAVESLIDTALAAPLLPAEAA